MTIQSAIQLFGGIGIFLFAIKLLSDSLQLLAGDRLRKLVGVLTRTPLLGCWWERASPSWCRAAAR